VMRLLNNTGQMNLDRLRKYVYAILYVKRKDKKGKTAIDTHVIPHAYSEIIRFPFVDRNKTISNDWYNVQQVLGVEIARNNYIMEPYQLMLGCDAKIDLRHLTLIGDYIFEKGYSAGIGLHGQIKHGVGFLTQASIEQSEKQLIGSVFKGRAEPITNIAVSTFMGTPPILGIRSRESQVKQMEKFEKIERSRTMIRFGKRKNVLPGNPQIEATNEDAILLAVKALMIETDPYSSIPTITVEHEEMKTIMQPDDIKIKTTYTAKTITDRVDKGLDQVLRKVRNLRSHRRKEISKPILPDSTKLIDMNVLYSFLATEGNSQYFEPWP